MHESADQENYGPGHRTFDCPWCGAISGIDPSHIGEDFDCPECHKHTKLTPKNARLRHVTQAPKVGLAHETAEQEAYGPGHRTFDCPWCGAIAGIDPLHIGEHFTCPECHKDTKLTSKNTRPRHVTDVPRAAPHHVDAAAEGARTSTRLLVFGAIAAVLVAVVLISALSSGTSAEDGDTVAVGPEPDEPPPSPAVEPGPSPAVEPATEPTPAEETPETPTPEEGPEAPAAPPAAPDPVATAREALAAWESDHAEGMPAIRRFQILRGLADHANEHLARIDAEGPKPASVRAFNQEMRTFIIADPARIGVAEDLTKAVRAKQVLPPFIEVWSELNFFDPLAREALQGMVADAPPGEAEYAVLVQSIEDAQAAVGGG